MKRSLKLILGIILFAVALSGILVAAGTGMQQPSTPEVSYPEGYREWAHVRSAVITQQSSAFKRFGGLHHIYANPKALDGYRTGTFADGAALVFDVLEIQEKEGTLTEGTRRFVDVMLKDSKRFASTGGWGFEEFNGDSKSERTLTNPTKQCFQCHTAQKESSYVFSSLRK
jgi:hypothetical protein